MIVSFQIIIYIKISYVHLDVFLSSLASGLSVVIREGEGIIVAQ